MPTYVKVYTMYHKLTYLRSTRKEKCDGK